MILSWTDWSMSVSFKVFLPECRLEPFIKMRSFMISKVFGVEPFIQTAIIYEMKPFDVNLLIITKQGQFFTRFSFSEWASKMWSV